jgi:hypothetical protein
VHGGAVGPGVGVTETEGEGSCACGAIEAAGDGSWAGGAADPCGVRPPAAQPARTSTSNAATGVVGAAARWWPRQVDSGAPPGSWLLLLTREDIAILPARWLHNCPLAGRYSRAGAQDRITWLEPPRPHPRRHRDHLRARHDERRPAKRLAPQALARRTECSRWSPCASCRPSGGCYSSRGLANPVRPSRCTTRSMDCRRGLTCPYRLTGQDH